MEIVTMKVVVREKLRETSSYSIVSNEIDRYQMNKIKRVK